jgi:hypothetical protein
VVIGAATIAIVALLVLGRGDDRRRPAEARPGAELSSRPVESISAIAQPGPAQPGPAIAQPGRAIGQPNAAPRPLDISPAGPEPRPAQPAGPDPRTAAADLERSLGRQRLWSSVQVIGGRVEVRSGSCADPAIGPVIDGAQPTLRSAGLTRLRCLAQSGAVVFERDL